MRGQPRRPRTPLSIGGYEGAPPPPGFRARGAFWPLALLPARRLGISPGWPDNVRSIRHSDQIVGSGDRSTILPDAMPADLIGSDVAPRAGGACGDCPVGSLPPPYPVAPCRLAALSLRVSPVHLGTGRPQTSSGRQAKFAPHIARRQAGRARVCRVSAHGTALGSKSLTNRRKAQGGVDHRQAFSTHSGAISTHPRRGRTAAQPVR